AEMAGTRGKGSKLKSRGLARMPDESEPLKTLISEADDGSSFSEEAKVEVLNSEAAPAKNDEEQLMDDGHDIGYEINDDDGNMMILTNLDEEIKLEDVSHGGNTITNIEVENCPEKINENETEADMTDGGAALPNVDVKGSNEGTNTEEPEEIENLRIGEEVKGPVISACVTNAGEDLAASEHVLEENSTENMQNDKEANELIAEMSVNTRGENEGDEIIKENASPTNEVIAVTEQVTQPKKKIIRRKLIKKNISLGNEPVNSSAENEGDESVKEDVSPANEVIAAAEKVIQPKKIILRKKLIRKNIALGNVPASSPTENGGDVVVSSPAENGGDESIKEDESPANEVLAAAEKAIQPKKKILRKILIRKNIALGNVPASSPAEDGGVVLVSAPAKNGGDESIKEDESPANEVVAATEKMIQPKKKIIRRKLIKKNISLGNVPVSSPAENGGDESIKEDESIGNEVKAAAEKGLQPKKKIVRKLIRKRMSLGNMTAVDEAKVQLSAVYEGSGVPCEAGTSAEVKPQCLEDNDASGEAHKEGQIENLKNEETVEGKPIVKINKKVNKIRKKNPQGQSGMQTASVAQEPKLELTNDDPTSNKSIEHETKNEEELKPKPGLSRSQKRKNRKLLDQSIQNVDAEDVDKSGSSKNTKLPKKVDSMGMIFMCNSETKKDCYKYKVFGLPAAKKDIVSKIYKGMRLFLFDIDLKMLYGVYKAAGSGSYNVEPRAFKSQYPSQDGGLMASPAADTDESIKWLSMDGASGGGVMRRVRFTILEDCLPIPEEKFKKVIKENYFTKNKFDCQLTNEQVKNLCKLFHEANKRSESKRGGQSQRAVASSSARVDRKRKWEDDSSKRVGLDPSSSRGRERRRKIQEPVRHVPMIRGQEIRHAPVVRFQEEMRSAVVVRGQEQLRLAPVVTDERYRHPVVVYDRESYRPPVTSSSLYQPIRGVDPPRTRIYTHERDPGVDTYRRDPAMDYRDPGISAPRDSRHYAELPTHHDPYATYREPLVYREPAYVTETRLDPYNYSLATEGRLSEYYRSDDNRPPLPLHRRY
ncbi:hypothetical protein KSS87_012766, partial [Heliosperma pusillum]